MIKHQHRIPTLLALFILAISLFGLVKLINYATNVATKASAELIPYDVKISNVTDTKATISWLTDIPTHGSVLLKKNGGKKIFFDDRTTSEETILSTTHHVTLYDLSPNTTYSFSILSNGKSFEGKETKFSFTTGSTLSYPASAVEPAYGKVLLKNNLPANGAIVYLNVGKSALLSTLVKPSGSWLIPLGNARSRDGQSYYIPSADDLIIIEVKLDRSRIAKAITDINHDSPVPTMVIGKSYNFQLKKPNKTLTAEDSRQTQVLGSQLTPQPTKAKERQNKTVAPHRSELTILIPEQNGTLTSTKPLFRGTGVPGEKVTIIVESSIQQGEVIVSEDGLWYWTPPRALSPGKHTITVKSFDKNGNQVVKKHTFIVFKSGTQVLGEATPSATLTPTATPPLVLPTSTPTVTPTLTPLLSPSPTATASGIGGPPTAGTIETTILLLSIGALLSFIGFIRYLRPLYP